MDFTHQPLFAIVCFICLLILTHGCDSPPAPGNHSVVLYTGTNFGAIATYVCESGYSFNSNEGRSSGVVAECTAQGTWELRESGTYDSITQHCTGYGSYLGCKQIADYDVTADTLSVHTNFTSLEENYEHCLGFCIFHRTLYLARQGTMCYCLSSNDTLVEVSETNCVSLCPDGSSMCGGLPDLYTVHKALDIDCGVPVLLNDSFMDFNGTKIGNSATYVCMSGYQFYPIVKGNSSSSVTVECTVRGTWEARSDNGTSENMFQCQKIPNYRGCRQVEGGLTGHYLDGNSVNFEENFKDCLHFCISRRTLYIARQGNKCYCLTTMRQLEKTNRTCDSLCPDRSSMCGSQPDVYTVFTAFGSCIAVLSVTSLPVGLKMESIDHCIPLCKGMDHPLAFWKKKNLPDRTGQCYCLDEIPLYERRHYKMCHFSNMSAEFVPGEENNGTVTITESHSLEAETCDDLFSQGFTYSADYYNVSGIKMTCNFYDGSTTCDPYWVAFDGNCYYFESNPDTAESQNQKCQLKNSFLVSIGRVEELNFLKMSIKDSRIWIGLMDAFSTSTFVWSDETLSDTYRPFADNNPRPAVIGIHVYMENGLFYNGLEETLNQAVCERSKSTYGCSKTTVIESMTPSLSSNPMGNQNCFETCRAEGKSFAATFNYKCYCLQESTGLEKTDWSFCDIVCSAHPFQLCGGESIDDIYVFVTEVVNQAFRDGCTSTILDGVIAPIVVSDGHVENCSAIAGGENACAPSWLPIHGSCYRFMKEHTVAPFSICQNMGAYVAVFETNEERNNVMNAIVQSPLFTTIDKWLFGLVRKRVDRYALYSNGAWITDVSTYDRPGVGGIYNSYSISEQKVFKEKHINSHSYICEHGRDFLGCYRVLGGTKPVISDFPDMHVRLCLEACKYTGKQYAGIHRQKMCYCVNGDNIEKAPLSRCETFCFTYQSCGGWFHLSIYAIDYDRNATKCTDLFHQGIMLSGLYVLGQGVHTYCGMYDSPYVTDLEKACWVNGVPCAKDFSHYIVGGYNQTKIFALEMRPDTKSSDLRQICSEPGMFSPSSVAAVYTEPNSKVLIRDMLRWSRYKFDNTGVLIGLVDEFNMGIYTWADSTLFRLSRHNYSIDFFDFTKVKRPLYAAILDELLPASSTGKFQYSCQRDEYYINCIRANDVTFGGEDTKYSHGSMSRTQCQQLCLAKRTPIFFLSVSQCVCPKDYDVETIVSSNASQCNMSCPGNRFQQCAGEGYYRIYHVVEDVAKDCQELRDNFVVVKTEGILYNVSSGLTQCETVDDNSTLCPPGFLAVNNKCYRFQRRSDLYLNTAADACFDLGSYPAVFQTKEEQQAVIRLTSLFTQLKTAELWQLGYYTPFKEKHVTSSLGHLLPLDFTHDVEHLDSDHKCIAFNVSNSSYVATDCSKPLPFICEISDPTLGLNDTYSCDDKYSYGIVLPKAYRTQQENIVECFKKSPNTNYIFLTQPNAVFTAPNSTTGFEPSYANLSSWLLTNRSWQGKTGMEAFVTVNLLSLFVVEGIVHLDKQKGRSQEMTVEHSIDGVIWQSFTNGELKVATENRAVWTMFPVPVVARYIKVSLDYQGGNPDIAFDLMGYPFSSYQGDFLRCVPDQYNDPLQTAPSVKDMKKLCRSSGNPFFTLYDDNTFSCVDDLGLWEMYPLTSSGDCPDIGVGQQLTALYTTTEFFCGAESFSPAIFDMMATVVNLVGVNYTIGTNVTIRCPDSYKKRADFVDVPYTCLNFGLWEPSLVNPCEKFHCQEPPDFVGAHRETSDQIEYLFEDTVQYRCISQGHGFDGLNLTLNTSCSITETWTPTSLPACTKMLCLDPVPSINHSNSLSFRDQQFQYGNSVTIACDYGFRFESNNLSQMDVLCGEEGQWVFEENRCIQYKCLNIPAPITSATTVLIDEYHAQYQCIHDTVFSDGTKEKEVRCDTLSFQWIDVGDVCALFQSGYFNWLYPSTIITEPPPLAWYTVRTVYECAIHCNDLNNSSHFSFSPQHLQSVHLDNISSSSNCLLYGGSDTDWTTQTLQGWDIFHIL